MSDTIAAISTATGEAGIGIVRMSGPQAIEIASSMFISPSERKFEEGKSRLLQYGNIQKNGKNLDEVLAVFMKGPSTYTREDVVEIYCHGGIIPLRNVLEFTLEKGARLAESGEFTKRAFLNGRLDLSQAEAVMDLITSKSSEAYQESLRQLSGSLSEKVKDLREGLLNMMALIVANIDFPEDEIEIATYQNLIEQGDALSSEMEHLLSTGSRGKFIREGINTVILGKPNVGKSSLLNALLREERAIVTEIPGTTRDSIEEYITLDDIVLRITDTAGIRETEDLVEKIGVERAKKSVEKADVIIALFDSSKEFTKEDEEILDIINGKPSIVLLNKWDLPHKYSKEEYEIFLNRNDYICVSMLESEGVSHLEERIKDLFYKEEISMDSNVFLTNLRHIDALKRSNIALNTALNDLKIGIPLDCVEVDLNTAMESLGEITGETIGEDILDKIFSEFCIGK